MSEGEGVVVVGGRVHEWRFLRASEMGQLNIRSSDGQHPFQPMFLTGIRNQKSSWDVPKPCPGQKPVPPLCFQSQYRSEYPRLLVLPFGSTPVSSPFTGITTWDNCLELWCSAFSLPCLCFCILPPDPSTLAPTLPAVLREGHSLAWIPEWCLVHSRCSIRAYFVHDCDPKKSGQRGRRRVLMLQCP